MDKELNKQGKRKPLAITPEDKWVVVPDPGYPDRSGLKQAIEPPLNKTTRCAICAICAMYF
jgi:hypothetical protein